MGKKIPNEVKMDLIHSFIRCKKSSLEQILKRFNKKHDINLKKVYVDRILNLEDKAYGAVVEPRIAFELSGVPAGTRAGLELFLYLQKLHKEKPNLVPRCLLDEAENSGKIQEIKGKY